METKITKGSWEVNGSNIQVNPKNLSETESICVMFGSGEEKFANAKLIAAAPDLLKALIPFANFFEKDFDNSEFITITMEAKIADIIAAKQAIIKAIG